MTRPPSPLRLARALPLVLGLVAPLAAAPLAAAPLAAGLLAGPSATTGAPVRLAQDGERATGGPGSLQELLARLRRERDERLEGLAGRVETLLAELRAAASEGASSTAPLAPRAELVALGPVAAPLLVPAIDPGAEATPLDRRIARHVAEALCELPTPAVTDELVRIAREGSTEGRRNALLALGTTPDPDRVSPAVRELYATAEGRVRDAALVTLAALGGEENRALLLAALADEDAGVVETALRALAEARSAAAAPAVLALARDLPRARGHVGALLAYLDAVPESVGPEHVDALLALVEDRLTGEGARVAILERLPDFGRQVSIDHKRRVRDLTRSGRRNVAEAAMVAASVLGDSRIQRELLAPYDDDVKRNEQWATPWHARAEIHYRIRDYRDAVRDYKQALRLARNDSRTELGDLYVGLARSYAAQGKDKDAADTLGTAPISRERLTELAREKVFAALLANDRYRGVFRLED